MKKLFVLLAAFFLASGLFADDIKNPEEALTFPFGTSKQYLTKVLKDAPGFELKDNTITIKAKMEYDDCVILASRFIFNDDWLSMEQVVIQIKNSDEFSKQAASLIESDNQEYKLILTGVNTYPDMAALTYRSILDYSMCWTYVFYSDNNLITRSIARVYD